MNALKREFLELLDKDIEFRYAIAGYLGLLEVLKRLDSLSEEQVKLREEQVKIWREIEGIREEQVKLREEQVKIWREIEGIREEQVKIWREIEGIREEQVKLREGFNRMLDVVSGMNVRLGRVERTLEKLTVDVEDEARLIVRYRVREEFGVDVELTSLILPELELNVYGVSNNICIIGEATVRGGVNILEELMRKIELVRKKYPDKLRRNTIPLIYVCLPLPGLIEEARRRNIWVLKATQDFHKPETILKND